jgi:ELWxxDGT repeat protein
LSRNRWRVCHPGILCEQLEDRIVLDAAGGQVDQAKTQDSISTSVLSVASTDPSAPNHPAGLASQPALVPDTASQIFSADLNVVLISKALDQIQGISTSVNAGAHVLTFDPTHDTFATINQALDSLVATTGHQISTLVVMSHGSEGELTIGSDNLTLSALNAYAANLSHLATDLAPHAQIQLFSCSLAADADGRILVNTLASFTGANVFASVDSTGGATGNWTLEYASNPDATMNHVVDTAKLTDLGVTLSQVYPTIENNWGKSMSGAMYYASDDGVHGTELWRSDGKPEGTYMVKDINPGSVSSQPSEMTVFDGKLYFRASDGNNAHGTELWCTDGTEAGTHMVKDISPGNGNSDPSGFTVVNGVLYFSASDGTTSSSHGTELWRTDGTEAGTKMVNDINPGKQSSSPTFLTDVNGTLFFAASDGSSGNELWRSGGTDTTTTMMKDINPGAKGSDPSFLTYVKETGTLFFSANDGTNGNELWRSDGTALGTILVKDINHGQSSSDPSYLTDANGVLFFAATDGNSKDGNELWRSDGTGTGTTLVKDINQGNQSSDPSFLTYVKETGTLYFAANDGIHGNELWKSDGTDLGTKLVQDMDPGHVGSDPKFLNDYNGALLFSADDGTHGYQLWRSDGTDSSTVLLKQIKQDGSSFPLNFARLNPLFFLADDGTGFKLWKTDGTAKGTVKVSDTPTVGGQPPPRDISGLPPFRGADLSADMANRGGNSAQPDNPGLFSTKDHTPALESVTDSGYGTSPLLGELRQSVDTYVSSGTEAVTGDQKDMPESESRTHASKDTDSVPGGHDSPASGLVKVLVLDNGDYSLQNQGLALIISHELWIPPMVKWYLAAVSEGRYRPGSLPREYERMIWDYLRYSSSRQVGNQSTVEELEARLAWQWADWRRQVVKDRGNADALPWTYFRGLSQAMILFYGHQHGGKVDYSEAISALHQNIRNLTIVPVQLPEDVGTFSAKDSLAR